MYLFASIFNDMLIALPALLVIMIVLGVFYLHSVKKTALYTLFAFYLTAVFSVVGLPSVMNCTIDITFNLVPFIGSRAGLTNSILNVLLFVPLGIMLPLFWGKFHSFKNTLLFAVALTVLIEVSQLFALRLSDVDDLIMNTLGAVIGYLIVLPIIRKRGTQLCGSRGRDALLLCGIVLLEMFFLQPFLANLLQPLVNHIFWFMKGVTA